MLFVFFGKWLDKSEPPGEIHHWMDVFFQLSMALLIIGFVSTSPVVGELAIQFAMFGSTINYILTPPNTWERSYIPDM